MEHLSAPVREIAIIIMKKAVTAVMVRRVKSLAARAAAADATAAVEHQSRSWKVRMLERSEALIIREHLMTEYSLTHNMFVVSRMSLYVVLVR